MVTDGFESNFCGSSAHDGRIAAEALHCQ